MIALLAVMGSLYIVLVVSYLFRLSVCLRVKRLQVSLLICFGSALLAMVELFGHALGGYSI